MLTLILGLFSSTGFGAIVGLLGGMVNRVLDLKTKSMDREAKKDDNAHEILLRKEDKEIMLAEYAQKEKIADIENVGKQIETDAAVEIEGYKALKDSYKFAVPTSADGWVDKASKAVRPFLTMCFFGLTIYVFVVINSLMRELNVAPSPEKIVEIWIKTIEWFLFQAGVAVGWWFAMRPNRNSVKGDSHG